MNPETHGGNRLDMAAISGRDPSEILDFSVNIRPDGMPEFLRAALSRATSTLSAYPSPHAEEALDAAARHHGLPPDRFVFGNGSNELIHALARAFKKRGNTAAYIVEPAFSEYSLACRRAGLKIRRITPNHKFCPGTPPHTDIEGLHLALRDAPAGSPIFLANPGNPSGTFIAPDACLHLMAVHSNLHWIIDEAFIDYVGPDNTSSVLRRLPENGASLRSLTKFFAMPGLRAGYLAASSGLTAIVRDELPPWNVNAFALAAAVSALEDASDFASRTRAENAERRANLVCELSTVPGVDVFPSAANYILFRWLKAPRDLYAVLLKRFGIAIRDCANYHGLEDGTWFRVAVRFQDEHRRLAEALRNIAEGEKMPTRARPQHTPALMLQGTSSGAGKSILTAAYCRIFQQDGYNVAPFKAQNMSSNSGVTANGEEMSRAQIVQAQAARRDPDVRMNPVLLKPHSDTGSQIIVLGQPVGRMNAREYFNYKNSLWETVSGAYDELAAECDIMLIEGAGSPGEVNLKSHDIVNMRVAAHARASVLLVGDIDRGGVYASFLGTWMTFNDAERRLLKGYIVNRFRGDASLLDPAHAYLLEHTGTPVLGVIPHIHDFNLPEEDMPGDLLNRDSGLAPKPADVLDIAVIMPRHISNHTDFAPLANEPDVRLRPVRLPEEWGEPDVVMLPGSQSVTTDLQILRDSGIADKIINHAAQNGWVFGICTGLQIMGNTIRNPEESTLTEIRGLGLMDLRSTLSAGTPRARVTFAATPLGIPSSGYELRHGITEHGPSALPLFLRSGETGDNAEDRICGYVCGRLWGTYLHGVFDDDAFRRAWIDHVRADCGLSTKGRRLTSYSIEKTLDLLADIVREHSDMQAIYQSLGLR